MTENKLVLFCFVLFKHMRFQNSKNLLDSGGKSTSFRFLMFRFLTTSLGALYSAKHFMNMWDLKIDLHPQPNDLKLNSNLVAARLITLAFTEWKRKQFASNHKKSICYCYFYKDRIIIAIAVAVVTINFICI